MNEAVDEEGSEWSCFRTEKRTDNRESCDSEANHDAHLLTPVLVSHLVVLSKLVLFAEASDADNNHRLSVVYVLPESSHEHAHVITYGTAAKCETKVYMFRAKLSNILLMHKTLSVLLVSILVATTALAEEHFRHWSVGLGGGPTIGGGFMGRYEWESGWGVQAAALPYYTPDSAFIVEGMSGTYTLDRNSHGSVYLSLGAVGWHRLQTEYIWPVIEGKVDENGNPLPMPILDPTKVRTWSKGFATGPGLGFRFNFFDNYVFSIDLPAALVFEMKGSKIVFDSFRPWPNLALMYNF